jgi:hypothetical protein
MRLVWLLTWLWNNTLVFDIANNMTAAVGRGEHDFRVLVIGLFKIADRGS